ncbi:MAG: hypothetical protein LUG98_02070 [Tannerellaceae bacterium]|nr:hypothetical protein [Tannerellaceae bacterium]
MLNGTTISSSVFDHALRQGIGGTVGGYMGGFSSGLIMTGNLKEAHSMGASGASIGLAAGLAQGAASGYIYARRNNLNPWTGKQIIPKNEQEKFLVHGLAKNRHEHLGLTAEQIQNHLNEFIMDNYNNLAPGNNTFVGKINGYDTTIKVYMRPNGMGAIDMYPGISGRITDGTLYNFGKLKW